MQLLTKFKNVLCMWFRAILNFLKFKVALNRMYRIFHIFLLRNNPVSQHNYNQVRSLKVFLLTIFSNGVTRRSDETFACLRVSWTAKVNFNISKDLM